MTIEDFGLRRAPFLPTGEMPLVPQWKFFRTVAGPGATAYPTEGSSPTVYYAEFLKGISFTKTPGAQSLNYTATGKYDYLFNLETAKYIEVGSVVLGFPYGGQWYTIDKVPPKVCQVWDSFTDTEFTRISDHTGESGVEWSGISPGFPGVATSSNFIRSNRVNLTHANVSVFLPYPAIASPYTGHELSCELEYQAEDLSIHCRYKDTGNQVSVLFYPGSNTIQVSRNKDGYAGPTFETLSYTFTIGATFNFRFKDCVDGFQLLEPVQGAYTSFSAVSGDRYVGFRPVGTSPNWYADSLNYCEIVC